MKLTFVGADHEVTGSCHFLEAGGKKILIDCGMEQGRNDFDNIPIPVSIPEIDYVLVTHAHIDHSGLIPMLEARGFSGQIFATRATCDLCEIMLLDSAHIQEFEAEWRNRKGKRLGRDPFVPLYTAEDATRVLTRFVPCEYKTWIDLSEGIRIRFTDVGHLLGSSAIEVEVTEGGRTEKIVFSGDIGNYDQPLLLDPEAVDSADYLLIESTYGDRSHDVRADYVSELAPVMQRTFDRGGNLVIPSFAVGRTQEMLYFIRQIKEQKLIEGHDGFQVFVDSPLAIRATTIYNAHKYDCFDEEARELVARGINPIAFPGLETAITADDSKAINFNHSPKVIISASGMCEAGRIKHHLKHNLWRPESTILFVGYQAEGTLGRLLQNGIEEVSLFGEKIAVKAEIATLPGISGHADREGLLEWASHIRNKPKKVFVVHGDKDVVDGFASLLSATFGWDTMAPYSGTVYDLAANVCEYEAPPRLPETGRKAADGSGKTASRPMADDNAGKATVFGHLIKAASRLMSLVRTCEDRPNKDLKRFCREITDLCDRWE